MSVSIENPMLNASADDEDFFESADFGDKNLKSSKLEYYKGKKGETNRLAILLNPAVSVSTHFLNGHFICRTKKEDAKLAFCCEKLGPSTKRFGTVVAVYRTNKEGDIDDLNNIKFDLKAWLLSEDKFFSLSSLNKKFPFSTFDISVNCTEEQYQRLTIQPCPESPIRNSPSVNYDRVMREVEMMEKKIKQIIAKKLSVSEIKEKLGLDEVPTLPSSATKMDFSNIASSINV